MASVQHASALYAVFLNTKRRSPSQVLLMAAGAAGGGSCFSNPNRFACVMATSCVFLPIPVRSVQKMDRRPPQRRLPFGRDRCFAVFGGSQHHTEQSSLKLPAERRVEVVARPDGEYVERVRFPPYAR
jgi:hypothetical protein